MDTGIDLMDEDELTLVNISRKHKLPEEGKGFIDMTDEEAQATWYADGLDAGGLDANGRVTDASNLERSDSSMGQSETVVIDCSAMQTIVPENSHEMDDASIADLSARFVDSLSLLPQPQQEQPQPEPAMQEQPEQETETLPPLEQVDSNVISAAEQKFNEGMEVISRFAEDVVKTWFSQMYQKDLKELFPDGLIGHTASVRMTPSEELLAERRKARTPPDEETRDGDPENLEDALGWELRLAVVDSNHRINLDEWKRREPAVLGQMQGLLKTAWGYIQYALESYALPNPELFVNTVIPSPWGTLYVLGVPDECPQIGVIIERPKLASNPK